VPRLRSAEIADRTAYPDIPVGAYGPPGSAWDRLGPDKFFSPRTKIESPSGRARSNAERCSALPLRRVVPGCTGSSRVVPRCPASDFFWEEAGHSNAECGVRNYPAKKVAWDGASGGGLRIGSDFVDASR
jgi:hypothetical protein